MLKDWKYKLMILGLMFLLVVDWEHTLTMWGF
jgi:hypothetical protein